MRSHSLPRQIVLLVSAVLLAVLTVLWLSLLSIRASMDRDAAEQSRNRMAGRIASMQEQVSLIASDYHNWTDVYLNALKQETGRLASNYGITAERGDIFQYAEMFDGPFAAPMSWTIGLGLEPQAGLVPDETRDALRRIVPTLDASKREIFDYFELRDGRLVMFSASYLLPEDESLLADSDLGSTAIAVIGKVLEDERLTEVAQEFSLDGLTVTDVAPLDPAVGITVQGVAGASVAWLRWLPPRPGTLLFWKMFPIMSAISATFVLVSLWAARLLRTKAEILIDREAMSYDNARTDALTGLPNRFALREHLLDLSKRSDLHCAAATIDLIRFKNINDTVGHLGGDAFLIEFSRRLEHLVDETTIVFRNGGDEFIIAISQSGDMTSILAEKCCALMQLSDKPINCNGVVFDVLASKGLAVADDPEMATEELLRRADRAMYVAKAKATQDVIVYDASMMSEDIDHKRIEAELRRALLDQGRGFRMFYQPIMTSGKKPNVDRYEALARWTSEELGPVSPDKFIHVAESAGLIVRLGWLLLDLVCQDMAKLTGVRINVNVSPTQLMIPGFAMEFANRIESHGIDPGRIEVEVTEQIVMCDDVKITKELQMLSDRGLTIALDDFGTGFASVGYLTRVPFNVLKIDRSFVHSMGSNSQRSRMVKSMIGLARAMDLKIVAEGVEVWDDAETLRAAGADFLQGYYFGRPVPIEDILMAELRQGIVPSANQTKLEVFI